MSAIEKQPPVALSQSWGVDFCDYKFKSNPVDFQDLMVAVAENRATSVEKEVTPLTTRIRSRNADLELLGKALSELTAAQATLKSDAAGGDRCSYTFSSDVKTRVNTLTGRTLVDSETKSWLEYFIQRVKSKIDGLNNESQTDMTRLQSLVDRRDESFSTASTLMTSISDTRSNLIRNL